MSLLITGATILDKNSKHHLKKRNVLVERGIVKYVGTDKPNSRQTINASGGFVSPGWVDMQALMGDPGLEHKEDLTTGSEAAAAGGFTDVMVLPNTEPVLQSKNDMKYILRHNATSLVQLHPSAAITRDAKGEELTEMIDLNEAGAIAFTDGINPVWNSDILLKSLQYTQKFSGLVINRPQDKWLSMFGTMHEGVNSTLLGMKGIPSIAEEITIKRDLELLAYGGGRLHFSNVSTKKAVKLIRKAKKDGLQVTCDVAAHQLLFDDSYLLDFDTNYKVNPPFRSKSDITALKKGLLDGTIDCIVSSHNPQDEECKKLEFDLADFGLLGLQTVLPMLAKVADELSWELLVDKLTSHPRDILGLDNKGIQEGAEACLTVFDPQASWTYDKSSNYSKSDNSPLFGQEVTGKVLAVVNNKQTKVY